MQQPHVNSADLLTSKMFDLQGKVALITGASVALGTAVAKELAVNGVDLVLSSVEDDGLKQLSAELRGLVVRTLPVYCDVTDEFPFEAMVTAHILSVDGGVLGG